MRAILYLTCSPRGPRAHSRTISGELVARLLAAEPGARVIERDLFATPPVLVDGGFTAAILASPPDFGAPALAASEALIDELESCDAVVIGTPMNNYTVPATLKTWIDHVVRIRRTFAGTPQGKVGLLRDRPTYVVTVAGGYHAGDAAVLQPDFLTPYLRAVLATIGIHDVRFLTAQGVTRGPDAVALAGAAARATMDEWLPDPPGAP